jgi:hypothetical protein
VKRTNEDQISKGALPHFGGLLPIHEMAATVLLPSGFVVFRAERALFAVADRVDAACGHPGGDQSVFHGIARLSPKAMLHSIEPARHNDLQL